jgi:hypothetical protein
MWSATDCLGNYITSRTDVALIIEIVFFFKKKFFPLSTPGSYPDFYLAKVTSFFLKLIGPDQS